MAKRDKNRSYMEWEYEWIENDNSYQEENSKREKQKKRREQKLQNPKYMTDWDSENETGN